ncbi:hypothetical protein K437DRAFT_155396 [Tilletiaria anomala UBC 951]|uniref:Uncharacterized protein n=1 Tax=Tilletiaria anomala (strain ATCC 24038 / CBS 436.72 / UBC 951) TaxID=1037660 RepID=A0A066VRU6_TILAU|nr:uncharacterized protein K437DRAFT_155396 [Tilletiaria anomala UBC 951]KDN42988.1 hypothetical protein K437DRAFT_155396 [Tilletiaria anomala UBC 951]
MSSSSPPTQASSFSASSHHIHRAPRLESSHHSACKETHSTTTSSAADAAALGPLHTHTHPLRARSSSDVSRSRCRPRSSSCSSRRRRSLSQSSSSSSSGSDSDSGQGTRISSTTGRQSLSTTFSQTTATDGDPSLLLQLQLQLQHQQQQRQIQQQIAYLQRSTSAVGAGLRPPGARGLAFGIVETGSGAVSAARAFSPLANQRSPSSLGSGSVLNHHAHTHPSPALPIRAGAQQQQQQQSPPQQQQQQQQQQQRAMPSSTHTPFFSGPSTPFHAAATTDGNLRPAYLDESGLSPEEYSAYVPALLQLKESPSGVDGLYDEQDALRFLREQCGIELRDEAMIMALFERTPLGIKTGHFFAWMRLASWAQQGQIPCKSLLFTQTIPTRTIATRKASGCTRERPSNVGQPPPPMISVSNSLGDIRSEALDTLVSPPPPPEGSMHAYTRAQTQHPPSAMAPFASPPPPASLSQPVTRQSHRHASNSHSHQQQQLASPPPPAVPSSSAKPHPMAISGAGRLSLPPPRSETASKPMPPLPPGALAEAKASSSNPFRDQAPQAVPARPPYVVLQAHPYVLHHAAPALPTPAPPQPPKPGQLPIDALLGFNPAPNPFKQSKPRIVRPTPVVASAAAPVPNPFRTPVPRDRGDSGASSRSPSASVLDGPSAAAAGGSQWGGDIQPRLSTVLDRLPPPLPPRAPISPLIQAGLNAASEVQRAKQALPPKTYTTIQRSSTVAAKPSKASRREAAPRLLTGQVAPPEVIAPLALAAQQQFEQLYGLGSVSASQAGGSGHIKRKSLGGGSSTHGQRRSVSEAATTLVRRTSEEDEVKSIKSRTGHVRTSSSVTNRTATRSPDVYEPPTGRRLSKLNNDVDGADTQATRASKGNIPSWLQEQDEIQRSCARDNQPSPIPEDIPLELDSPSDEMSENAMSAASIERPSNPFNQRNEHTAAPPPASLNDHRPLGRSKTLNNKNPPPAPPRRRLESFPSSGTVQIRKATVVADVEAQGASSLRRVSSKNSTPRAVDRPPPIEEEVTGVGSADKSARQFEGNTAATSPASPANAPAAAPDSNPPRPKSITLHSRPPSASHSAIVAQQNGAHGNGAHDDGEADDGDTDAYEDITNGHGRNGVLSDDGDTNSIDE